MHVLVFFLSLAIQQSIPGTPLSLIQNAKAPAGLIEAAQKGRLSDIREFSQNPGFGGKDDKGRTALVAAAEKGQKAAFAELIAIANDRVKKEASRVAVQGQPAVADGLFAVQARMEFFNAPNADGVTPLMYAASHGWQDLVEALLEGGADPSVRDNDGRSAIDHAEDAGYSAIASALLNTGK